MAIISKDNHTTVSYRHVVLKHKPVYEFFKRSMDIICSIIALIILSPVFLVTAIAIKHEDGGTVFFSQLRVGKNEVPFRMYKFRSMCMNAETMLHELQPFNEAGGPAFKMAKDPRLTKIGNWIRTYSIDELPQLVNILRGDMSIVGPRPPLPNEVAQYNDYQKQRLLVKPGLTCYWQCGGRSHIGFDEWMQLDMRYIEERGFFKDIEIILRTVPAVFRHVGAY